MGTCEAASQQTTEIVEKEERFEPVARRPDPPRWRTDS